MNILIASDSFKDSLTSSEVANIIEESFKNVFSKAKIKKVSLADGGEGTVKTLIESDNGKLVELKVKDPLGREIDSYYGIINNGKTAVIEMATASGLELLKKEERNPLKTSTYGVGELINHALENGVKEFILGIGGSATNDAGLGMLEALGVKFFDKNQDEIENLVQNMDKIDSFDITSLKEKFKNISIKVACDVKNPLCGENGASHVFGKQKGANEQMIMQLDKNLSHFAKVCEKTFNKVTQNIEGSGAAGGLGFALLTFLNAKLESGIDLIMKNVNLEDDIKKSDCVITGEGKIDKQTIEGKTPIGVARLAKKYDKKVIAIAGCVDDGYEVVLDHGIDKVFDCMPINTDFETIKKNAKKELKATALKAAKDFLSSVKTTI